MQCQTSRAGVISAPKMSLRPFSRSIVQGRPATMIPSRVGKQSTTVSSSRRSMHIVNMAKTESLGSLVGQKVPDFTLADTTQPGRSINMYQYTEGAPATLMIIMCNHCPFVVHLAEAIADVAKDYEGKGVKVLAVSSNSVQTHPKDGPEEMNKFATKYGYNFPYLYDENQEVAKAYQAACTPEFMVIDGNRVLQYHGQFDASRPAKYGDSPPVTGADVRKGLDTVLAGKPVDYRVVPAIGCNIKWTPGNAPAWFSG